LIKEKTVHPASSSFRIVAKFSWGNLFEVWKQIVSEYLEEIEERN
jgi:hypothetical protein